MLDQQLAERDQRRANLGVKREEIMLQSIPEPVVIKNDAACKGLKLLSDN